MELWLPLEEHPGYSISNLGRVRNDKRDNLLTITRLPSNHAMVSLMVNRRQTRRSVARLVCDTFVGKPNNPSFTTPIHFDGDLFNCNEENLDWRPRWFAQDHTRQFKLELPTYPDPVREIKTDEILDNCWAAVFKYGLLYMELLKSIRMKTYVFPTMQLYEWV
jgi:hypothetical protein